MVAVQACEPQVSCVPPLPEAPRNISLPHFSACEEGLTLPKSLPAYEQWLAQLRQLLLELKEQRLAKHRRPFWMNKLRVCLEAMDCVDAQGELFNLLLELADNLCDWPLIIAALEKFQLQLAVAAGSNTVYLQGYANACRKMGLFDQATAALRQQLWLAPDHTGVKCQFSELMGECQQLSYRDDDLVQNDLRLLPLQIHHLDEFRWQYDYEVAELCNLPEFETDAQWLDWFYYSCTWPGKHVFAIVHKEHGFIGSVGLQVYQGVGFFYYWLGANYQYQGFGPQAVDILLQLGYQYHDMHCCYAKVYSHNTPSHKGMFKLGFNPLGFSAAHPYDNEMFYYRGADKSREYLHAELSQLLHHIDPNIKLTLPHNV